MPSLFDYGLFISHAWDYHDDYKRLVDLLKNANNFRYSNYSVPKDHKFEKMTKGELEEELRQQIRPASCVLALGGIYMSHSDWIQFELNFAVSLNKTIIGIIPWGNEKVSTAVSRVAKRVVGWNTDNIIGAIRTYS
jgi:hypothetical protein